ncbi:MAG: hypothetical protein ACSLE5_03115, partial [Porticoccaceae bacterium]
RAGPQAKTHALHPSIQQATQAREVEVLRSFASNYFHFNCYGPLECSVGIDSLAGHHVRRKSGFIPEKYACNSCRGVKRRDRPVAVAERSALILRLGCSSALIHWQIAVRLNPCVAMIFDADCPSRSRSTAIRRIASKVWWSKILSSLF